MRPSLKSRGIEAFNALLRQALPGRCAFCLALPTAGAPWCESCLLELPWNEPACMRCAEPLPIVASPGTQSCGHCLRFPPSFSSAHVPLRYEDDVATLVQRFKFHASPRAGTLLLELLVESLGRAGIRASHTLAPQALVSVPLHAKRARERGFDQADWLARRLGKRLGITCIEARRLRITPTQRGLGRGERQANLRGAFRLESRLPARVVLVDDVMTTGATFDALASACLAAGAERVEVWAAARTAKR